MDTSSLGSIVGRPPRPRNPTPPATRARLDLGESAPWDDVEVATGSVADLVRAGREALTAADWDRARAYFEQAEALGETAEVLDGLSDVAHFQGDYERALELKERAFSGYRRADMRVEAADTARWLAFMHGTLRGNFAVASGWMARAADLLEDVEECAAHGWLALDRAPLSRDNSEREKAAVSA